MRYRYPNTDAAQQEENKKVRVSSPQQALLKAQQFCAYQERSQQEMRDKLYEWGLWPEAVENVICELIAENFLNELRFAQAYVGGKFRIKQWGRIKIKQGLQQHKVSSPIIKEALAAISSADYAKTLKQLIEARWKKEKELNIYKKTGKVSSYLVSRGFETDLVWEALRERAEN